MLYYHNILGIHIMYWKLVNDTVTFLAEINIPKVVYK